MLSLLLRYFILKLINILIDINDANNIYSCIFDSNMFTIFDIASSFVEITIPLNAINYIEFMDSEIVKIVFIEKSKERLLECILDHCEVTTVTVTID